MDFILPVPCFIAPRAKDGQRTVCFQSLASLKGRESSFISLLDFRKGFVRETSYRHPALFCGGFCSSPRLQYDAHAWAIFNYVLGLDHCDQSREQTCSACSMAAFLSSEVKWAGCETCFLDPARHSDQIILKICIRSNVGTEAKKSDIQNSFTFQLSAQLWVHFDL